MHEREMKQLRELYESGVFQKPFYSDRLHGIEDFDSYESFTKIPFMYKQDIRRTKPFERTATPPEEAYGFFSSSGTTGKKTFYLYSKTDKQVHEKFVKTYFTPLGIGPSDIGGVFAPVDTGVMAHTMMWQFTTMGCGYVNCPEPSPRNIIESIQDVPVTLIATRPSVVCSIIGNPEYERIARESSVRMMLMGGGFLTNGRRHLIEKAWGAECYGMFGMSEVFGPMAGECRAQDGYHYLDKYLMVEIVDPVTHEPLGPGEYGVAVYTTLWNKGFPLLRYWTDDYIAVDTSTCRCGSDLPRLRYKGRLADSLNINGSYVFPSMLEECLFTNGYFGEYRAVQGDRIRVILEKTDGFAMSGELKQRIDELFMSDVVIEYVDREQLLYDGHGIRFTKEDR